MSTALANPSVQVKITLPVLLQQSAQSKASQYGLTLSTYIKHLVLSDVKEIDVPTFTMSKKTERAGLKALEEYHAGKTTEITDVDDFFNKL